MKRVILGTAGHIDHGKTELVKALTGIDTDRLKEEKQRGISIELGFAFLDLGDDIRMGIVDVPGHEKFVRQMVAGAGGIDIAALVIALDEGVMPQTVEHFDILTLLGIPHGLVVLTKLDLVDHELAMLAEEDAKDLVKGTFLADAPMVKVSSRTGEGIERLKEVLADLARKVTARPVHGLLRLPVDRVFTLKGHGTIVAGTLISGTIAVGDEIEILPAGLKTSVRSLESHNRFEEKAFPGERVAVNLRGVEQAQVHRGDVLTHTGQFKPSYMIDVKLTAIPRTTGGLTNRKKVRLHHFTSEVEGVVVLPDLASLLPGQQSLAQIRTASETRCSRGGQVCLALFVALHNPRRRGHPKPQRYETQSAHHQIFQRIIHRGRQQHHQLPHTESGPAGITRQELLGLSGLSAKRLDGILEGLKAESAILKVDAAENRLVHGNFADRIRMRVLRRLAEYHTEHPLKQGISKQELRTVSLGSDKLFKTVLDRLVRSGDIAVDGDVVRLSSHQIRLGDADKDVKERLVRMLMDGGNTPPTMKEILNKTGWDQKQIRTLLGILEKENKVVRVSEELYYAREFIDQIKSKLRDFFSKEAYLTPSRFAEITGASRKFNIPLLEYLDRERFTVRVGDQRVLRGSGSFGAGGKPA